MKRGYVVVKAMLTPEGEEELLWRSTVYRTVAEADAERERGLARLRRFPARDNNEYTFYTTIVEFKQ